MPRISRFGCPFRSVLAAGIFLFSLLLSLTASQQGASKNAVPPDEYRIGAGDVLQILVWKEPDVSLPETMVQADGKISVPLVGALTAAGLTIPELQDSLIQQFGHYIHNPVVTVHAKQINSRKVYVMGQVKKEGPVLLLRPMTVLQAINEAGGFTEFAKKGSIYVLRKENGKQVKLPFDYKAVVKGKKLEQNISLKVDDTIIVP